MKKPQDFKKMYVWRNDKNHPVKRIFLCELLNNNALFVDGYYNSSFYDDEPFGTQIWPNWSETDPRERR